MVKIKPRNYETWKKCLREFGMFNMEKNNQKMIGVFKEDFFESFVI